MGFENSAMLNELPRAVPSRLSPSAEKELAASLSLWAYSVMYEVIVGTNAISTDVDLNASILSWTGLKLTNQPSQEKTSEPLLIRRF